jgi:serine/threonine protein kinase/tetratricopeptide (TPR) repeat protein
MRPVQPGTIVAGRYIVDKLAGVGGMSEVYKAHDANGQTVAIKVLKSVSRHLLERFTREINALERLDHPAIVRYLGSGITPATGQRFLVMEWLDGIELGARLRKERLDLDASLRLGERMAEALAVAHAAGIVHRDVKPSNIFLCGGEVDRAKLLDFGIARWVEAGILTATGARFGTPAYMSPEQVRGERSLDSRADVFSLGCVLFECMAGRPPFAARDDMAIFGKILFQNPPRLSEDVPGIPEPVEELVKRLLAREPGDRPASGAEVAAEIRRLRAALGEEVLGRAYGERSRRDTLTNQEQRLVSVVVATIEPPGAGPGAGHVQAGPHASLIPDPLLDSIADQLPDSLAETPDPDTDVSEAAPVVSGLEDTMISGRIEQPASLDRAVLEGEYMSDDVRGGLGTGDTDIAAMRPERHALDTQLRAVRTYLDDVGARWQVLDSGLLVAVLENRDPAPSATAVDQAVHAARCALALREAVPAAPVALATGRIVVGRERLMGEVIERAVALLAAGATGQGAGGQPQGGAAQARGELGAGPARVRIDDVTALLIRERFRIEGDPTHGFALVEEAHAPEPRPVGRLPFVGRRGEMATLMAAFEECIEEQVARAILLTGPAGYGKSRLCEEFLERVRQRCEGSGSEPDGEPGGASDGGPEDKPEETPDETPDETIDVEVWLAQGDPVRTGSPLHLLASAVERAAGAFAGASAGRTRPALRRWVARHVPEGDVDRVSAFLGELLHVGAPDAGSAGAAGAGPGRPGSAGDGGDVQLRAARRDLQLMGDQVRRACHDLLAAETAAHPLMLVIEDLHWGDRATVEVLDAALRTLSDRPLLIIAVGRPEVHDLFPGLWSAHDITEIRLHHLSRRAAEQLVRAGLGEDAPRDQVEALVTRADGHPYYLEELIRRGPAGDALPRTVAAMVDGRLGGLDPDARRVLRAASIFGRTFWAGGVRALVGDGVDVHGWLEVLIGLDLIVAVADARLNKERAFCFRHDLLREGAYEMLTADDRTLGHRLAATWLEAVGEQDARVLAAHFDRGGAPERAVPYYIAAAQAALGSNDFDDATALVERGVVCGAEGPHLGALRRIQMEEQIWRGDNAEVVRLGTEALKLLERGSRTWYDVLGEAASAASKLGAGDRLDEIADELETDHMDDMFGDLMSEGAQDEVAGDERIGRLVAMARVAMLCFASGREARGQALLDAVDVALGTLGRDEPVLAGHVHFCRAFRAETVSGDPAAVLHELEQCVACFEAVGDLRRSCLQRRNVGYAKLELGLFEAAEADLRAALTSALRLQIGVVASGARQALAVALAHHGRLAEARALAIEAREWFGKRQDVRMATLSRIDLAAILAREGDLLAAEREARASLEHLAQVPGHARLRPMALANLARILAARGSREEAAQLAAEAAGLLEAFGSVEKGEALVRLVHAEALEAGCEHGQARVAIARARERVQARADRISREDWRKSFLENIPEHARTLALAQAWGA